MITKNRSLLISFVCFWLYAAIVLILHKDGFSGDEGRYFQFAQNIIHGYYSPPNKLNLWNGPGYPLLLAPFLAIGVQLLFISLLNAVFHALSVFFVYKSTEKLTNVKTATITSILWGLYFIPWQTMPLMLTEHLSIFLISAIMYFVIKASNSDSKSALILGGFSFGFLALTKVIFGYVLVFCLITFFIVSLVFKNKHGYLQIQHLRFICLIGIALLTPYLIYTYSLTNKLFYLSNAGGMSLYHMSTPVEGEYGDWNNENYNANCFDEIEPCNDHYFC